MEPLHVWDLKRRRRNGWMESLPYTHSVPASRPNSVSLQANRSNSISRRTPALAISNTARESQLPRSPNMAISMLMVSFLLSMPPKPVHLTLLGNRPNKTLCSCGTTPPTESSQLSTAGPPPVALICSTVPTRTSTSSRSIMSTLAILPSERTRPCQTIRSTTHQELPRICERSSSLQGWCVDLN